MDDQTTYIRGTPTSGKTTIVLFWGGILTDMCGLEKTLPAFSLIHSTITQDMAMEIEKAEVAEVEKAAEVRNDVNKSDYDLGEVKCLSLV